MAGAFAFPDFFEYPPYFTIQPTPETQRKQIELWKSLILRYCQHHKMHVLNLEEVDHPLFANPRCDRKLSLDARRTLINALVSSSTAEWLDGAGRTRCLVLWRSVASWGEALHDWACELGHQGGVVTVDEIGDAREGPGGDFVSVDEEVIVRAAKYLEALGKAALLPGEGGDDTGVKFL